MNGQELGRKAALDANRAELRCLLQRMHGLYDDLVAARGGLCLVHLSAAVETLATHAHPTAPEGHFLEPDAHLRTPDLNDANR